MKSIVYSLFGYERKQQENCFSFDSYLRGFFICLRFNRLIYPEWITILETDKSTYSAFGNLFDELQNEKIKININNDGAQLCEAMLWRLKPVFEMENQKWKYTHVLCRDIDSPSSYREAQAVQYWINKDKAMHAITDSISHVIPLMGGMIGIRPDYFTDKMECKLFSELMSKNKIDLSKKGSDQIFLNEIIYPQFARQGNDSITQHYFNGHANTFLSDYRTCRCSPVVGHDNNCTNNIDIDLSFELKESNNCSGHIGASGWYSTATEMFLRKHKDKFVDLHNVELKYPEIFYWAKSYEY